MGVDAETIISYQVSERIRQALGLQSASLIGVPNDALERIASLCEATFSRYPRKLESIIIIPEHNHWSNGRYCDSRLIMIRPGLESDKSVKVFVHEFGHAIFAALNINPKFRKTLKEIREQNYQCLLGSYEKTVQQVPVMVKRPVNKKYKSITSTYSIRSITIRMNKHFKEIPHEMYDEYHLNFFSGWSTKSLQEYFCEGFAECYMKNRPSDFATRIGNLIDSYADDEFRRIAPFTCVTPYQYDLQKTLRTKFVRTLHFRTRMLEMQAQ